MTAPNMQHTGAHQGHTSGFKWGKSPGLYVENLINGRTAEPFELEVQRRAYDQQRSKDAELVRVPIENLVRAIKWEPK